MGKTKGTPKANRGYKHLFILVVPVLLLVCYIMLVLSHQSVQTIGFAYSQFRMNIGFFATTPTPNASPTLGATIAPKQNIEQNAITSGNGAPAFVGNDVHGNIITTVNQRTGERNR